MVGSNDGGDLIVLIFFIKISIVCVKVPVQSFVRFD